MNLKIVFGSLICSLLIFLTGFPLSAQEEILRIKPSVVKIYTVLQQPDFHSPWKMKVEQKVGGTGFYIGNNHIITNAHVVSDGHYILVHSDDNPKKVKAKVVHLAHDCDLALIKVEEKDYFKGASPLQLGDLPELNTEVITVGYPIGGSRLSITRGVVSRIENNTFYHSGWDAHLTIQTDAAINPGNSGGPVIQHNKVVGVAFQNLPGAENLGYVIPTTVVKRFLTDIEDGKYDGYVELGIVWLPDILRNQGLKKWIDASNSQNGILLMDFLYNVDTHQYLMPHDLITHIDGHPIANDGSIKYKNGSNMRFDEIIERKLSGNQVKFDGIRKGKKFSQSFSLFPPRFSLKQRNTYQQRPRYFIFAGLVFISLTKGYLNTLKRGYNLWDPNYARILYYFDHFYSDQLHQRFKDVVVMSRRLPHNINTYITGRENAVVAKANGQEINSFSKLVEALEKPKGSFHVIEFEGRTPPIILDVEKVKQSNQTILKRYGIAKDRYLEGDL